MCIAIAKSASKEISKETMSTCWQHNPDGAGFMYNANGRLKIKKGFFTFKEFWQSYSASVHNKGIKAAIHFRIKTHGEINHENCHPFRVNEHMGFIHNGIISSISTKEDKSKSDTWHFNEQLLKPMVHKYADILETDSIQMLIGDYIGHSKLVFLDDKDDMWIINSHLGEIDDGIWYSNNSYKERKPVQQYKSKYKPQPVAMYRPPPTKDMFSIGTLFTLSHEWHGYPKGNEGVITAINSDYTADVELTHKEHKYVKKERIAFFYLDVVETTVMEEKDWDFPGAVNDHDYYN